MNLKFTIIFIYSLFSICFANAQSKNNNNFNSKRHHLNSQIPDTLKKNKIYGNKKQSLNTFYNPNFSTIPSTSNFRKSGKSLQSKKEIFNSIETGLPIFISIPIASTDNVTTGIDQPQKCMDFLTSLSEDLKINNSQNFKINYFYQDEDGTSHFDINQEYKKIKVANSNVKVHLNTKNKKNIFNGNYHLIKDAVNVIARVNEQDALLINHQTLLDKTNVYTLNSDEMKLLDYASPQIEKVIFPIKTLLKSYVLAYHISSKPNLRETWDVYISAENGRVLDAFKTSCHIDGSAHASAADLNGKTRDFNTYLNGTSYDLIDATKSMYNPQTKEGIITTLDASNTFGTNFKLNEISSKNNIWNNPTAISAHLNASTAFEYYLQVHQRNSINGKGGDIISVINAVDEDGKALDNAYWNGKAIFYGNGRNAFKPLAKALDVAGHEMTHGVIQSTANLLYQGESGAINESMADVFACFMDTLNWTIGEDIVQPGAFPGGALRSVQDPHNSGSSLNDNGYQPRIFSEKYKGTEDNGGVHINSGICNYAFYLIASKIGRKKSEKIYYKALTTYLTQNAQFSDLRIALTQSAKDLFQDGSNEVVQVSAAFDITGILLQTTVNPSSTLEENPGQEKMLLYNTDDQMQSGLVEVNTSTDQLLDLTDYYVGNKPSITDDGSEIIFVGTNKKIYVANTADLKAGKQPSIFDNNPIWSSVSISKTGERIAAITANQDTSIYVFDRVGKTFKQFILYNPTFTPGVEAEGPVYADVIEWDYKGENLVYDAFNSIPKNTGDSIQYWDINLIKVWDSNKNDYGDGSIFKLITNLEEGESIGNPSFAKNSPFKIAFDYFNEKEGIYAIFGYDVESNDINAIVKNNSIGWPSFSKDDSKIAFTTYDSAGIENIGIIDIGPDKISALGTDPFYYFSGAKWSVFYANGSRPLPTAIVKTNLENKLEIISYPNPVKEILNIKIAGTSETSETFITILNQLGEVVLSVRKENYSGDYINIATTNLPTGLYTLIIINKNASGVSKIIKI